MTELTYLQVMVISLGHICTFKTSYSLENYLLSSSNSKIEIQVFAKIRISSHKLVDIENCHCKREYVSSVK